MTQTLDAVFEDGSFKPVDNGSLPFSEGQRVKLTVELPTEMKEDLLGLAGQVYDGLSDKDIDEVESIALDRSNFFHDRPASRVRLNLFSTPIFSHC
jgi:predicted DNA-binding antitoxin AbrB/MazE fold protein